MDLLQIILVLLGLCVVFLAIDRLWTRWQERGRTEQGFPREWVGFLERNIPLYLKMPVTLRHELQERVLEFIEGKDFEACGGLEQVTDEMKVTIAGNAALLLLNKRGRYYSRLRSVLVYPDDYWAPDPTGAHEDSVHSGESWTSGSVILSWDAVRHTTREPGTGANVVLHEFAHQLDQEAGDAEGVPQLENAGAYRAWARVFDYHYKDLKGRVERGEPIDLDEYGAENPAEFFAVATEAFFGSPVALRDGRPELYDQLRRFYRVDPAHWVGAPAGAGVR